MGVDLGRLARNECHIWDIITLMHHIVWCRQLEIEMTQSLNELLKAKIGYVKPETDKHNHDLAKECMPIMELHLNGLITDYELLSHMKRIASQAQVPTHGVLDNNTGLRYTPKMIMGYLGMSGKIGFDGLE